MYPTPLQVVDSINQLRADIAGLQLNQEAKQEAINLVIALENTVYYNQPYAKIERS